MFCEQVRKTFEAVPRLHELYDGGGDEKHYQRRLLAPGRLALENPIETELNSIAAKYYQNLLAVGPLSLKLLIDAAQAQTKAGRTGRSAAAAGLAAWTPAVGKVYGACLRNMKRTVGRLRPFQPEPDTGDASVSEASASDATAAFCPARHALVYHTTRLGHSCDMCRARIGQGARVKRCHECDYDACLACSPPPPPVGASSLPDYNQPYRGEVIAFYKRHNRKRGVGPWSTEEDAALISATKFYSKAVDGDKAASTARWKNISARVNLVNRDDLSAGGRGKNECRVRLRELMEKKKKKKKTKTKKKRAEPPHINNVGLYSGLEGVSWD